ncbi:MAG: MBL fold metallo-hydrolase [Bacteroidota bacterium]
MNRRNFLYQTALISGASVLPFNRLSSFFQDSPFIALRRNVGTFTGRGGTIGWLINNDGVVIVDSQNMRSAETCISGLKERTRLPFDLLVNTHHHGDHTGGNGAFKGKVTHIVAHEHVPGLQKARAEARGEETLAAQVYADVTFSDTWKTNIGDETLHLTHYGPAHTKGDAVIFFEQANVAHMGDLVFNRVYPFIDRAGGASIENWAKVLRTAVDDLPDDAVYIFGHHNPEFRNTGTKDDVLLMASFLEALLDETQQGIAAGKPKEEIIQKEELGGFEVFNSDAWRLTLSANLGIAYEELTAD